jgi:hypothetical protein
MAQQGAVEPVKKETRNGILLELDLFIIIIFNH